MATKSKVGGSRGLEPEPPAARTTKRGRRAAPVDTRGTASGATTRRAGGGTGDPGRHKRSAEDVSPTRRTRKARAGTTTSGKNRRAGSGGLESTMKNKRVAPSRAVSAAEGSEGPPSRKSTRRAANRVKGATQLTKRAQRASTAPKTRATRATARTGRPTRTKRGGRVSA